MEKKFAELLSSSGITKQWGIDNLKKIVEDKVAPAGVKKEIIDDLLEDLGEHRKGIKQIETTSWYAEHKITDGELSNVKKIGENRLGLADLEGGTFTITNGGVFGSLLSTPILNMPQSGILGMHKIEDRPVVINKEIVIRPMMYVAFSYDHRIIDGGEAVSFLKRIKECIESPERMMVEI